MTVRIKIRNLLILILAVMAVYGIILTVAELPPYGMPDNPVHNEVSERYINNALEDTGVLNMVTSIVLDYRAYDTMFETIVLFTAALAVVITIKTSKGRRMVNERLYSEAYGFNNIAVYLHIWLLRNFSRSCFPGGSFAGGIIVGLSFIAFSTIYGIEKGRKNFRKKYSSGQRVMAPYGME